MLVAASKPDSQHNTESASSSLVRYDRRTYPGGRLVSQEYFVNRPIYLAMGKKRGGKENRQ